MGLVASQARLLNLFGRKSDVEYRCQTISNKRMRLSFETGEIARVYADALSNTAPLDIVSNPNPIVQQPSPIVNQPATSYNQPSQIQNQLVSLDDLYANNLRTSYQNTLTAYWLTPDETTTGLANGSLYLTYNNAPQGVDPATRIQWKGSIEATLAALNGGSTFDTGSSSNDILSAYQDVTTTATEWPTPPETPPALQSGSRLYTEDDAAATAIYEAQTAILQAEDKRLELELKNLETQHKCLETEIDAVQKVIDKNIEKSFKTLG